MTIDAVANDAAQLIYTYPQKSSVRVISHYDADGISGAAIICHALLRAGYRFHATLTNTGTQIIEDLKPEDNPLVIFCDIGSGQLQDIEKLESKVIICDHHLPQTGTGKNIIHLNAHLVGFDGGREACGASMAFALAQALDERNKDLVWLALSGAIGDRQAEGGFKGYNKTIFDEGVSHHHIQLKQQLMLPPGDLQTALEMSIDPFFVAFSGKNMSSLPFLQKIGLDSTTPVHQLSEEEQNILLTNLNQVLEQQGVSAPLPLLRDIPFSSRDENLYQFASMLNACGRLQQAGLGLSICLGDSELHAEGIAVQSTYRKRLLESMVQIEKEGIQHLPSIQYFYIDQSTLGGTIAGLSLKYLPTVDKHKPMFSLSIKGGKIQISGRATQNLVKEGINLAEALGAAAHQVRGHGGGHPIAAGASIPVGTDKEFLEQLDIFIRQTFKQKTN